MIKRVFAIAALLPLLAAGPALADPLPVPTVVFVDLDKLSTESKATQSLNQQVEAEIAAFRGKIAFKYEAIQEELRMLRVQSAALSADERAKRQQDLQDRIAGVQDEEAAGIEAIQARGDKAFAGLQQGFDESIALVGGSMEVDMVLQKTAYDDLVADGLLAPGAEDMTSVVLVLLNDKYPTVALPPAETTR